MWLGRWLSPGSALIGGSLIFDADGEAGLYDRSSRPHRMPTQTSPEVEELCWQLGVSTAVARTGSELSSVSPRTVSRILRRHRVPYLAVCDPMTSEVIRASKTTAVHYERSRPRELVHMDIKKIGRIPAGGGWRAHGRQIGKTYLQKKARIGFDYIHSVVDDHSLARV
jgi:hypothetical protein